MPAKRTRPARRRSPRSPRNAFAWRSASSASPLWVRRTSAGVASRAGAHARLVLNELRHMPHLEATVADRLLVRLLAPQFPVSRVVFPVRPRALGWRRARAHRLAAAGRRRWRRRRRSRPPTRTRTDGGEGADAHEVDRGGVAQTAAALPRCVLRLRPRSLGLRGRPLDSHPPRTLDPETRAGDGRGDRSLAAARSPYRRRRRRPRRSGPPPAKPRRTPAPARPRRARGRPASAGAARVAALPDLRFRNDIGALGGIDRGIGYALAVWGSQRKWRLAIKRPAKPHSARDATSPPTRPVPPPETSEV
jgi:hypothetical protein